MALYYPIYDMWTWYQPVAEPLRSALQPEMLRRVVDSFTETFFSLLRAGYPVCLVDHRHLAEARTEGRRMRIGQSLFEAVVMSGTEELPGPARKNLETWHNAGGLIIEAAREPGWQARLRERFPPAVSSSQPGCLATRFERDGVEVTLLVNTTKMAWAGTVLVPHPRSASFWHFDDGTITRPTGDPSISDTIPLTLRAMETVAVVSKP